MKLAAAAAAAGWFCRTPADPLLYSFSGFYVSTFHLGSLPLSVCLTANYRWVALCKPWVALIPDDGVDRVLLPPVTEHVSVLHLRRGAAGHWAFLAGEWQVVVAGHVVPLAALLPDHHHTVFSGFKVTIRLVWPPVFILQWSAICPAEVILYCLVVQSDPLVVLSVQVDKVLLLRCDDADQMCVQVPAALLRVQPLLPLEEVQVAVPLKLSPTFFTLLLIMAESDPVLYCT